MGMEEIFKKVDSSVIRGGVSMDKSDLKSSIDIFLNCGAPILGSIMTDTLMGTVAPGIVAGVMSYKQQRFEKNIMIMLEEIRQRMLIFESRIAKLSTEERAFVKEKMMPLVVDNIIEESQTEKIQYIINGMETILEYKIFNEDIILTYYDILQQLRINEIRSFLHLINYKQTEQIKQDSKNVESRPAEGHEAISNYIVKKLERLGLVTYGMLHAEIEGLEYTISQDRINICAIGQAFINFIKSNN